MIKRVYSLLLRYIILLLLGLNLNIFYIVFVPLTIYPVFWLLSMFFQASLSGNTIIFNGVSIILIDACISGAAYFLLLILNLTTPMPFKKRVFSIIFSFILFLIINVFRIFVFSLLLVKSFSLFNFFHLLVWYFFSGIAIFLIWILTVRIFKIKEIPAYSDFKFLFKQIKR